MDANLLVLFIVGSVGRELIAKHRRLQEYTAEDYDMLIDFIEAVDHVFVTPNTLTEASNLLRPAWRAGAFPILCDVAIHD